MRDNESVDRRIADDFRNWNDFSHALTSENNESCSDQRVLGRDGSPCKIYLREKAGEKLRMKPFAGNRAG